MYDVIAIGDIKLDTFVILDDASVSCELKMPECQLCLEYGAKITVDVVDSQIAGTAPNVAVGLARMNLKTAVMSNMGIDTTYQLAMTKLAEEGVSTKFIRPIKSIPSAYSVILTFQGDRTVLASQTKRIYTFPKPFPKTKWIYVGEMGHTYEKMFAQITSHIKKTKVKLGFNPGTIQIAERKHELFDLIAQTTVLFVNLQEAQAITGLKTDEVHHLATALWKLGAKRVVITDGKQGSYDFDGEMLLKCPIFPGKVVGTIGAGDAFATGYVGCLIKNVRAFPLVWGAINSASVVGKVGPQPGLLSDTHIIQRARKHKTFKPVQI
jgi:sugar/nucleoside kinase (ribokinase family)